MGDPFFELIIKEHQDMVFVFLLALVRDRDQAEDLTQETFLQGYEQIRNGAEVESLPAWLRGIARNLAAKTFREKDRQPIVVPDVDAVEGAISLFDSFELGDTWTERVNALRECRQKLPGHQQGALKLRYEEGLSTAEIAQKNGWVGSTVYQILWAARAALRKCIEKRLQIGAQTETFRADDGKEAPKALWQIQPSRT